MYPYILVIFITGPIIAGHIRPVSKLALQFINESLNIIAIRRPYLNR